MTLKERNVRAKFEEASGAPPVERYLLRLYVLKSRGMAHSNELREFALTDRGLDLDASGGRGASDDGVLSQWKERERHAAR